MPAPAFGEQTFRNDNAAADYQGILIHGSVTTTKGHVWAIDKDGNEVMVDRTLPFRQGSDGKLRIIVHRSALPYQPSYWMHRCNGRRQRVPAAPLHQHLIHLRCAFASSYSCSW
jgi:hypothetical protein